MRSILFFFCLCITYFRLKSKNKQNRIDFQKGVWGMANLLGWFRTSMLPVWNLPQSLSSVSREEGQGT